LKSSFVAILLLLFTLSACSSGRFSFENDVFAPGGKDDNYTNGVIYEYNHDDETTIGVGQVFYTPDNLRSAEEIKDDRPYGGLLFGEISRTNIKRRANGRDTRETASIRVGCTGKCSLARETQKFVHNELGFGTDPKGWRHQIDTEPIIGVKYALQNRTLRHSLTSGISLDNINFIRANIGNDITRFTAGTLIRIGSGLDNSFGPELIQPTAISKNYTGYFFTRAESRFTPYNIFIDNHLFNGGTNLDLEYFGNDYSIGFVVEYGSKSLAFEFVWRDPEFDGDSSHKFGAATLRW